MTILTLTYPLLLSVTFTALWPYLLLFVTLMLLVAVLIQNHLVRKRVRQSIFKATSTYEMMEKALKIADNDVVIEAGDLRGNGSRCADTGNRAVAVPPRLAKIAENQPAFVSEIPVKENILRLDVPVKNMSLHTDLEKRKQVVSAPDGKLHVVRGVVVP